MADARVIAFPPVPQTDVDRDTELWVDTLGEVYDVLADRLERGETAAVVIELRMMARDYADVPVPMLPQDR